MVAWGDGKRESRRPAEGLERGRSELWTAMNIFTLLIRVMVSWVNVYVKTYEIVQFKYVQFIVMSTLPQLS